MKKVSFPFRILALLLFVIFMMTGCGKSSHQELSKSTLVLGVSINGNQLEYVNHNIEKHPFYTYRSDSPLYEADMFDSKGHKLQTVFFGKIFFMGKGPVYQLTFPYYKNLHRITVYQLDSSSGHITNRDDHIALDWIYP